MALYWYQNGAILDKVQWMPDIFRCLRQVIDTNKTRGQFLLTGSNNFLLRKQISQSLAGRVGTCNSSHFSGLTYWQKHARLQDDNLICAEIGNMNHPNLSDCFHGRRFQMYDSLKKMITFKQILTILPFMLFLEKF